ncbi:MAG: hypothetical protein QM741_08445 [Rudaea sp.]|uniref:hypothetical protein n=1 Tax=Rudaea sp. TaxID=2136325 RepID=UPI0039E70FAC
MSALRLCGRLAAALLFAAVPLCLAAQSAAATITVGAGSSFDFGDARVDLGCSNLAIAGAATAGAAALTGIADFDLAGGSFAAGASGIALGGDFANAGSFVAGSGGVAIVDACGSGTSTLSGTTGFHDLVVTTASAKRLVFPVGLAQSVAHALTLQGVAGQLLKVVSASAGQRGVLALNNGAAQTIAYVDARDNDAGGGARIAPGPAASFHSIDGGNLVNWFADATPGGGTGNGTAVPAPALGCGRWLLLALLMLAAWRGLSRQTLSRSMEKRP